MADSSTAHRLALFLPSLRGGGAERVMLTLARGFAERGRHVDLVLVRAEGPYLSEVPGCVRLVDLRARRTLASLPGLVRYLRRERPEAVLSALDHANVVTLWARQMAGVPERVVVSVHNTLSQTSQRTSSLKQRLLPLFVRFSYRSADAVVAVSRGAADDLARTTGFPRSCVKVIYNPVVTPQLARRAEEQLSHPWFRPGQPPVVLGVGRLTAQKDFATLVRAFPIVRQRRPVRLMILGEGEERSRLELLTRELGVEEDVSLPGFVDNPYKYMSHAAVFVLSSRWEGLPTVLIEALGVGTPVVATDCPSGPAEILEDGKWGTLVPPGCPEALAAAAESSLEREPGEGERARRIARAREFSLQAALSRYAAVLFDDG